MAKKKENSDLLDKIRKQAGRLDTPAPKVFRDKSKYTRKQKHRRAIIHDDSSLRFFYADLSSFVGLKIFNFHRSSSRGWAPR